MQICDFSFLDGTINLSQVKKEYTEFYSSNSSRIKRIENQLRAITNPNTYQPQQLLPTTKSTPTNSKHHKRSK